MPTVIILFHARLSVLTQSWVICNNSGLLENPTWYLPAQTRNTVEDKFEICVNIQKEAWPSKEKRVQGKWTVNLLMHLPGAEIEFFIIFYI